MPWQVIIMLQRFLSTLSLRRATQAVLILTPLMRYFYPRSPCGERPCRLTLLPRFWIFLSTLSLRRATIGVTTSQQMIEISIHALLAESDWVFILYPDSAPTFLSTLSLRRATNSSHSVSPILTISIHALLAESDGPV